MIRVNKSIGRNYGGSSCYSAWQFLDWSIKDVTFNAVLCDNANADNTTRTAVMVHGMKDG